MVHMSHTSFYSLLTSHHQREHKENKKKLKDFLRKCVDLESESHDSKKIIAHYRFKYTFAFFCY